MPVVKQTASNMGYAEHSKPSTPASINYMQVIPNSHYWSDLNQIITNYNLQPEELTKDYLLTGLLNCIKNGYKIKGQVEFFGKVIPVFTSIEDMVRYINDVATEKNIDYTFIEIISNTILSGLNLTNGRKMERREVYKRIDAERDYQDATWVARRTAVGTPDEEKDVAEWINYMEFHLQKAKNAVYHLKTQEALAEVRKVTALGVRAMEIHGAPERGK
jgi:hypothetical protein